MSSNSPTLYRIGAVSKLSGVPVPTLRIWQSRYKAFTPATSEGQHRLYNDADLHKAVMLKTLTGQGHGIRLIAGLNPAQLQQLLHTSTALGRAAQQLTPSVMPLEVAEPTRRGVVGDALVERLQSRTFQTLHAGHSPQIQLKASNLEEAQKWPLKGAVEVLMVSVNSLNGQAAQTIGALAQQLGVRLTVVLYGFGQKDAMALLNSTACLLHRNTLDDATLADIVQSTRPPRLAPVRAWADTPRAIPERQFSDAVLQRVANIPSQVLCECPRHVAELIAQLGRFEDYSLDCLNQSPKDQQLHSQLNTVAATARALFEEALKMVAAHEGISLQEPS